MKLGTIGALAAALALIAPSAVAQATTIYYACVDKTNNNNLTMTTAAEACKPGSTRIQWNDRGPQGPKGDIGAQGPAGPGGIRLLDSADRLIGTPTSSEM
jgi:hypothetical protein